MLWMLLARSTGDSDAVLGSAGILALRDRTALLARRVMTTASSPRLLLTMEVLRSLLPTFPLGIDETLTARPGWPELKMSCDVHSLFRLLETWHTSRLTFWLMSSLVAMNSRWRS